MDTHIKNIGLLIKMLTYVLRVLKKHLHGNTHNHPEHSEGSPRRQQSLVTTAPPLSKKYKRQKEMRDLREVADIC